MHSSLPEHQAEEGAEGSRGVVQPRQERGVLRRSQDRSEARRLHRLGLTHPNRILRGECPGDVDDSPYQAWDKR